MNQMLQKLALKLLWHWGSGRQAYSLGWRSQKALKTIFGGGCFGKAQQLWRDVIFNAAKDARTYEFLSNGFGKGKRSNNDRNCANFIDAKTVNDYLEWDQANVHDIHI